MRIGYCTYTDPGDRRSWSGTHYFILQTLRKKHYDVIPLGPLPSTYLTIAKVMTAISRIFFRKKIQYIYIKSLSKKLARELERRIQKNAIDILFIPAGSFLITYLKTEIPIIYLSDATFALLLNYYPSYSHLWPFSVKDGNFSEKRAIEKATRIIYSSEWAATSAIRDYGCDSKKISVIPFGANIQHIPGREEILVSRQKLPDIITLLFIGSDWERKGGPIAFKTLVELNRRGIPTELIVCGVIPPKHFHHERMKIIGYLNKEYLEQFNVFYNMFLHATFLVFPTRGEAAGIVSCEAAAFGLPVIATDTGGVSTYIINGRNGYLLSLNACETDYADVIQRLYLNNDLYKELCIKSRDEYEMRLNWDSWGEKVSSLINEIKMVNNADVNI